MRVVRAVACCLLLTLGGPSFHGQTSSTEEPLDIDLVEREKRRLIQIDASLTPKKKKDQEPLPELDVSDLELRIEGNRIEIRYADRVCWQESREPEPPAEPEPGPEPEASETTVAEAGGSLPEANRTSFVFYLEHMHLTQEGQVNALSMLEELIPTLVRDGNRGMLVSSGRRLLQTDFTPDAEVLLGFLRDKVSKDSGQWTESIYAENENSRYIEILRSKEVSPEQAKGLARRYQREEVAATSRQLQRFAATLGSLADLDPPKAVLYFADIIRQKPGEHYLNLFNLVGETNQDTVLSAGSIDAFAAAASFDRVTAEAGAHGIRLYTIRSQGLRAPSLGTEYGGRVQTRGNDAANLPTKRYDDARDTMVSFAMETGGTSFRGGTDASSLSRIVDTIENDLSCVYLVSFYPGDIREDQKLPVRLRFDKDSPRYQELNGRYEISTRGQIVVQSPAKRRESVLFAAHAAPSAMESDTGRISMIPLGFDEKGEYHALVQFVVDNPELPPELMQSVSWDLGLSHVFREKVANSAAKRVQVDRPGIPVVLEAPWTFRPGENEIVAVGYERRFGQVASVDRSREWRDPDAQVAHVSPIAAVQPAAGIFIREDGSESGARKSSGALDIGDGGARTDQPTYLIGLVCRGKRAKELWIDRKLEGNVAVDFGLQHWEPGGKERCVQIRDLIRENQVGWGDFSYRVRVYDNEALEGEPVAEAARPFAAIDPDGVAPPAAEPASTGSAR